MKPIKSLLAAALCAALSLQAQAFSQETHKRIAMDAVRYMQLNPGSTNRAC